MPSLHIETPLLASRPLAALSGRDVWLKMESSQPAGSFKTRGIGVACREYAARGATRFVSSSGGNAGIAAAFAGRRLGLPVVVVVPETTTETARTLLRLERAEVVVHGASWQEANARAQDMLTPSDAFIHPFDDPLVWTGHATMINEIAGAGVRPGAVLLSVGGGGLLCGVLEGMHAAGWHDVPVFAVETAGAASLARSVEAGERIALDAIDSIASSLGAKQVCERAFAWTREHPVHSVVVSDRDALDACWRFLDDHRTLIEPACGAALAPVYAGRDALAAAGSLLVIVCGGATASLDQLRRWTARLADD